MGDVARGRKVTPEPPPGHYGPLLLWKTPPLRHKGLELTCSAASKEASQVLG